MCELSQKPFWLGFFYVKIAPNSDDSKNLILLDVGPLKTLKTSEATTLAIIIILVLLRIISTSKYSEPTGEYR